MGEKTEVPIVRLAFEAAQLVIQHPPRIRDRNKKIVYSIACPEGSPHGGTLVFSRWAEIKLPEQVPSSGKLAVVARADVFAYEPSSTGSIGMEWYLNFADEDLFVAYGSGLLAQDELQVAEHPALGALREALRAKHVECSTTERGHPTPVLIRGVERRCAMALDPNAALGRPNGLYGQQFAKAGEATVKQAVTALQPPTTSHILAMAAPAGGSGPYKAEELEHILATAYTGFRAAVLETKWARGENALQNGMDPKLEPFPDQPIVVIHTGFWGCGAFGGNRDLMALLQLLAAQMAGVDRLVFHTFDQTGMQALERARTLLADLTGSPGTSTPIQVMIGKIQAKNFKWGVSDGN